MTTQQGQLDQAGEPQGQWTARGRILSISLGDQADRIGLESRSERSGQEAPGQVPAPP
ncbi:hypothetical protein [Tautonia sociabilis]|uniref:hypothetical protein n=1 Tax=Tautonia sociabilis TaxID=2080755 RepID=UPI0013154648|nr:hypothetical protein [Tautonia sociabilis]